MCFPSHRKLHEETISYLVCSFEFYDGGVSTVDFLIRHDHWYDYGFDLTGQPKLAFNIWEKSEKGQNYSLTLVMTWGLFCCLTVCESSSVELYKQAWQIIIRWVVTSCMYLHVDERTWTTHDILSLQSCMSRVNLTLSNWGPLGSEQIHLYTSCSVRPSPLVRRLLSSSLNRLWRHYARVTCCQCVVCVCTTMVVLCFGSVV